MSKLKVIPWDKFFKLQEDEIIHFKVIPDRTVDNNTLILAKAMHELSSAPQDRISFNVDGVPLTYRIKDKTFFDIIIKPKQACFYLSVHKRWAKFMEAKMKSVWSRCTINEVRREIINDFDSRHCIACDLRLKQHNIFSLKTSTKDLDPLNSLFAVQGDLKAEFNEQIRVSYVFDSMNRLDWQTSSEQEYDKFKKGVMPKRMQITQADLFQYTLKGAEYILSWYIELRMLLLEGVLGFIGAGHEESQTNKNDDILKAIMKQNADFDVMRKWAEGGISRE